MLVAMFAERESHAIYFLQEQDMTRFDAVNYISHGIAKAPGRSEQRRVQGQNEDNEERRRGKREGAGPRGHDALDAYCVNLNKKARSGKIDPLIGRELEVDRTIQILCRRSKNNPLYVGDPGVGKTAIAEGLAHGSSKRSAGSPSECNNFRPRYGRAFGRNPLSRRLRGAAEGGAVRARSLARRRPLYR